MADGTHEPIPSNPERPIEAETSSDYGSETDSVGSDLTSIASSVFHYTYENGRLRRTAGITHKTTSNSIQVVATMLIGLANTFCKSIKVDKLTSTFSSVADNSRIQTE